eukprot:5829524-Amphidinium_carterae.2
MRDKLRKERWLEVEVLDHRGWSGTVPLQLATMLEAWSSTRVVEESTFIGVHVRPSLGPSWHEALEEHIQALVCKLARLY